jgi:hypothetical protein
MFKTVNKFENRQFETQPDICPTHIVHHDEHLEEMQNVVGSSEEKIMSNGVPGSGMTQKHIFSAETLR